MSFFNFAARELNLKVAYVGPPLAGKASTLTWIRDRSGDEPRGTVNRPFREPERPLVVDFLPKGLDPIRGFKVRIHAYTLTGSLAHTEEQHTALLEGIDAFVFMLDGQMARTEANQEARERLELSLAKHGRSLAQVPHCWQLNKRDLPECITPLDARAIIGNSSLLIESCWFEQWGAIEALKIALQPALHELRKQAKETTQPTIEELSSNSLEEAFRSRKFFADRCRILSRLALEERSRFHALLPEAIRDTHPFVRAAVLTELTNESDQLARPFELLCAREQHPLPQRLALQALTRRRAPEAMQLLQETIDEEKSNPSVRYGALDSLATVPTEQAQALLQKTIASPQSKIAQRAKLALDAWHRMFDPARTP